MVKTKSKPKAFANLPTPLTSFVGRKAEITKIKQSLTSTRLLTLTGVGGCGKTRLALRVASDFANARTFKDGICWVDLSHLTDPTLVPRAMARSLGLREAPDARLMEALSKSLGSKDLLLVLDNCEHLTTACAGLVETLLQAAPNLKVLATSREPLQVPGEKAWLVPSLLMPEPKQILRDGDPTASLMKYDGIRLLVERAASILPSFGLTPENANAVLQICQRLDGIPLALELAATQVNVLTVAEIAERLNDRLALLALGNRAAVLPRHQTLRATLDWSYDLLSEKERVFFPRLAVFAGGFTLDAAEAICSGKGIEHGEILEMLSRLVHQSLVVAQTQERRAARYHLLETIRQYGVQVLQASSQSSIQHRNHAQYFCELAERIEPELRGPAQVHWLGQLEIEHDNFRAALAWSLTNEHELALRLTAALSWFWRQHNHFSEGRRWLDAALATDTVTPVSTRIRALTGLGSLAFAQNDDVLAAQYLDASLALARSENDKTGIAWSLHGLARVANYQRDYTRAAMLVEESLRVFQDLGDRDGLAYTFYIRGLSARLQGNYAAARQHFQESLKVSRPVGDVWLIAWTLIHSARVEYAMGDLAQALEFVHESLELSWELKTAWGIDVCLQLIAQIAGAYKRLRQAARLLSVVASLDETYGFRAPLPKDRADIERILTSAKVKLGAKKFAAAWAEGHALTLEQAVEEGLGLANSLAGKIELNLPQVQPASSSTLVESLNPRELQVLRLIASGHSNREIADQLMLTSGTIKWHANNLFSKLGVHSRTQAIVKARELNLV